MRRKYLDNIRWMTVILVVVYHVFYIFNACGALGGPGCFSEVQPQDAVQFILYPWIMTLLFVVSGMSARFCLENQTDRSFLRARTVKLLVPSTIGLFVFWWIQGYINANMSGAFDVNVPGFVKYFIVVVSGVGVLWYIQLLWLFSLFLVLIRKVERNRLWEKCANTPLWLLIINVVLFWAFAQVLNTPIVVVYHFGLYGFSFFLGYFVFSHDEVIEKLRNKCIPLIIMASVLGIAFTIFYWDTNYADKPVFNSVLSMAYSYMAVLAILGSMKRWADKSTPCTEWMTKKSWGLYLFHYLGISTPALLLYGTSIPPVILYLIVALSGFAVGFILPEIISRIPFLRWCVMGIGKRRDK